MPNRGSTTAAAPPREPARLFAVLGDETRLRLVSRLCHHGPTSITDLTEGFPISRQAITKHLQAMEQAGLVRSRRHGRERVWQVSPRRLADVRRQVETISQQWDDALGRLRRAVED